MSHTEEDHALKQFSEDDDLDPVMPVVMVEGINQPLIFQTNRPIPEHIQRLKELEMRDDDVVLMAHTKGGTHWLWEVVTMVLAGKAEYEKRIKENMMMEAQPIESIEAEPSPRVLNTHLPFRCLPRQILEKKVKVVNVYRNVKDTFVSMFFHYRQIPGTENLNFKYFERVFFSEIVPTGNYFTYLKQISDTVQQNPDLPFFITSYEDLKEDPEKVIKRLGEFLGKETTPQLCKDIAEATGFAKLKEATNKKIQSHIPEANLYRKGQVGDWKNHLTVAQSERFDAAMEQMKSYDLFKFRYEI